MVKLKNTPKKTKMYIPILFQFNHVLEVIPKEKLNKKHKV